MFCNGFVEQPALRVTRVVELGLGARLPSRVRKRVRWAGGRMGQSSMGWVPDATVFISNFVYFYIVSRQPNYSVINSWLRIFHDGYSPGISSWTTLPDSLVPLHFFWLSTGFAVSAELPPSVLEIVVGFLGARAACFS